MRPPEQVWQGRLNGPQQSRVLSSVSFLCLPYVWLRSPETPPALGASVRRSACSMDDIRRWAFIFLGNV